ncbi:hypothetical protein CRG98_039535 [Punica granatum]|uniref:Uncharacterized protein n=1 Tax=Punica granatum TaxID=22663 RepID=A0A2I0I7X1_PUNGR|nr:hypothetical protein CRG98_039535 [Punica granatum]
MGSSPSFQKGNPNGNDTFSITIASRGSRGVVNRVLEDTDGSRDGQPLNATACPRASNLSRHRPPSRSLHVVHGGMRGLVDSSSAGVKVQ